MIRSEVVRAGRVAWSVAMLFALGLAGRCAAAEQPFNIAEARKSVVFVRCLAPGLGGGEGSGFLVSKAGLIYTNRHVVQPEGDAKGTILLVGVPSPKDPDELEWFRAELVYATPAEDVLDFAILKIAGRPGHAEFPSLPLSHESLALGDPVAVLGYPHIKNDQPSLSFNRGSVSSSKAKFGGKTYCQTDAAVNPGNSGGPLVNAKGEAVGIVTAKKMDAENIGFALYLSEVRKVADAATSAERLGRVRPQPGPIDPAKLPKPEGIAARLTEWEAVVGRAREGKDVLVIDNNGGEYWLATKRELPESFQVTIPCMVQFEQGRQHIQPSQRSILRCLAVRFASDDTKTDILEPKGYLIKFTHMKLLLYREGSKSDSCVAFADVGNSATPMSLTISYNQGRVTISSGREKLLEYRDPEPISGRHKLCVGGYLSQLAFGDVGVSDLTRGDKQSEPAKSPATKPSSLDGNGKEDRE